MQEFSFFFVLVFDVFYEGFMKDLELGFCDKNITPFGGMVLMKKMMDHLGFPALLKATSKNPILPKQILIPETF